MKVEKRSNTERHSVIQQKRSHWVKTQDWKVGSISYFSLWNCIGYFYLNDHNLHLDEKCKSKTMNTVETPDTETIPHHKRVWSDKPEKDKTKSWMEKKRWWTFDTRICRKRTVTNISRNIFKPPDIRQDVIKNCILIFKGGVSTELDAVQT